MIRDSTQESIDVPKESLIAMKSVLERPGVEPVTFSSRDAQQSAAAAARSAVKAFSSI